MADRDLITTHAKVAGAIARKAFDKPHLDVWDKAKDDPVTEVDIAVNHYLAKALKTARPDYGWLSEESRDDASRHKASRSFVVDPIDGTRAFINRQPNFVVSIGLIEDGQAVAGVLYNPITDELFTASAGGGAYLNGKAIKIVDQADIEGIKMVGYPRKFRRMKFPSMDVSIMNSMAYRIARVASGSHHATISFTPKSDWDLAAADIIAREAGAVITDIHGDIIRYDRDTVKEQGVICAGPGLHALLLDHLVKVVRSDEEHTTQSTILKTNMETQMSDRTETNIQLLHLVIGGELIDPNKTEFKDLTQVDFVGAYGSYVEARSAWKAAAQRTVDNAHMRYFVLHAHELIDPDQDGFIG